MIVTSRYLLTLLLRYMSFELYHQSILSELGGVYCVLCKLYNANFTENTAIQLLNRNAFYKIQKITQFHEL